MGIYKSWADGSFVASFVTQCSSGSGLTSNFGLSANHQLLVLFSSVVAGLDGILFPAFINT